MRLAEVDAGEDWAFGRVNRLRGEKLEERKSDLGRKYRVTPIIQSK